MPLLEAELHRGAEHAQPVAAAAPEVDGGGLRKIFGRTGDLPDVEVGVDDLRQHLVVEHEVVGIAHERHPLQHLAGEGAVWYSDSFCPTITFWNHVRQRLKKYL